MNFSFFALYSLLLLSFFLYLKSVPIYVIVHVLTAVAWFTVLDKLCMHATMGVQPSCAPDIMDILFGL